MKICTICGSNDRLFFQTDWLIVRAIDFDLRMNDPTVATIVWFLSAFKAKNFMITIVLSFTEAGILH